MKLSGALSQNVIIHIGAGHRQINLKPRVLPLTPISVQKGPLLGVPHLGVKPRLSANCSEEDALWAFPILDI